MTTSETTACDSSVRRAWWWQPELAALSVLVLACYFTRLAAAPVCGEESRWASAAREMIASGDWIVPRQQGDVFPERPPLGSWLMALTGLIRGGVDLVAVRLPSACAILLLTWLIYGYARAWTSRLAAFASAVIFATSGQVLVLGRFGETEAVFTLFVAGALLAWHWGYLCHWHPGLTWSLGYSMAALGALAKGLQAPVYFVAATGVYLAMRRDWRCLISRWHALGLAVFACIVGLWLVPFAREQWHAVDDIWAGLAQDRFTMHGLAKHLATYPIETLVCLLPWSPLLFMLAAPGIRRWLAAERPGAAFLVVAIAVTYPTVWLAASARGRYYMPLYPCVAVLIGLVIEYFHTPGITQFGRDYWRRYVRALAVAVGLGAVGLVVVSVVPVPQAVNLAQSAMFLVIWATAAVAAAGLLVWCSRGHGSPRPQIVLVTAASFLALACAGAMINVRLQAANDLTPSIAKLKQHLTDSGELVSLGRVYHRFVYSYETPIRQVPWPMSADDLPADVTYFCYDWHPWYDTEQMRNASDSRTPGSTPGKLPFEWEKVAEIPCDPVKRGQAHRTVIIGRVRQRAIAEQPSLNRPVRR